MDKENNELISIIVPVYNSQQYLRQCLESLLNQTYKNLQIICIDDGSTDDSLSILNSYKKKDKRIYIYSKKNEGVSQARNYGLSMAKGKYIMFVDSDDWIDICTCEIVTEFSEYDLVMWPYVREMGDCSRKKQIFNNDIKFNKNEVKQKLHRRMIGLLGEELHRPENADALCTVWGKLYRLEIIKKHNIQFNDIREIGSYEDGLFNLQYLAYIHCAIYINHFFYHYRKEGDSSITSKYNPNLYMEWNNLFQIMNRYIKKNNLGNSYIIALNNRIVLSLIVIGINIITSNYNAKIKIDEINKVITSGQYTNAINDFQFKYLPIHWKVFFLFAKFHFSFGIYILLLAIQKIRRR